MAKKKVKRKMSKDPVAEALDLRSIEGPDDTEMRLAPIEMPTLAEFLSQRDEERRKRMDEEGYKLPSGVKKKVKKVTKKRM